MEQLTWMLGFIPDWFWNIVLILSILLLVASWVLKFVPFISNYKLPLQVVGVISLVTSVWFLGAAANEKKWMEKVRIAEEKAVKAESEATLLNEKLKQEAEKKVIVRDEKTRTVVKYIDSWITKEVLKEVQGPERIRIEKVIEYIERCPVPKELLDAHNAGARGEEMKK